MTILTSESTQYDHPGLERISSGNPKVVVGITGVSQERAYLASYAETGCYPHLTVDVDTGTVHQHIPLTKSCTMFGKGGAYTHRQSSSVWVLINRNAGDVLSDHETRTVTNLIMALVNDLGAANEILEFPLSAKAALANELPLDVWQNFSGVVPISRVPRGMWQNASPWTPAELFASENASEPEIVEGLGPFKGKTLSLGSGGKKIAILREVFNLGEGEFDEQLEELVKSAQLASGIDPNGMIDSETWVALQIVLDSDTAAVKTDTIVSSE